MAQPKRGKDGLTDLEREAVRLRRNDPVAPWSEILKAAGYAGDEKALTTQSRKMMRNTRILKALIAPVDVAALAREIIKLGDAGLKDRIKTEWLAVLVNPRSAESDKIKAGRELMSTIKGGYVPIEVDSKGTMTMEWIVQQMGGKPPEHPALPGRGEDDELGQVQTADR